MAGANNNINVLDNSPLFDDLLDDLAPVVPYVVNGVQYRNGYYLADGIYPEWASFVKSFTVATDPKHTYFKQRQESARKDVERAFGVLQGRWGLIQQPARAYEVNTLRRIMYAGIIMHNMILEDQNMSVVDWKHVYSNPARSRGCSCFDAHYNAGSDCTLRSIQEDGQCRNVIAETAELCFSFRGERSTIKS
ncbi:ALP1-like protein isoform X1 [Tanacetum coccineum]